MTFSIAIVGRPNVGKSTLFNRLVGKKLAIVDNTPGVTRDLREGQGRLADIEFTVIDTAGLEEVTDNSLQGRMRRLTESALDTVDICLFLIDAREGVTPADEIFAKILRKRATYVILGANKAESDAANAGIADSYRLGFGDPVVMSAEHGEGMSELHARLMPIADEISMKGMSAFPEVDVDLKELDSVQETGESTVEQPLHVAVVGRPNAGKSTLVNKILGKDRMLTGPEAGITRDAISVRVNWNGTQIRLFDTAGIRKKAKVREKIEKLSVSDGLRAVRFAEVVVLLLDASKPFEQQDLRLADLAEREGRAVVLAVNKWDMERHKSEKIREIREKFARLLPKLRGTPLVTVSAITGLGMKKLFEAIKKAHEVWNRRVVTSEVNRWLAKMIEAHPPPAPGGKRIRLRYMTQARTRPPGFVVMCSNPDKLPESYARYLANGLREDFDMPGTPIRIHFRSQTDKNPYKNVRAKKTPSKLRKHLSVRRSNK